MSEYEDHDDRRRRRAFCMQLAVQAATPRGCPPQIILSLAAGFEDYLINGSPGSAVRAMQQADREQAAMKMPEIAVARNAGAGK